MVLTGIAAGGDFKYGWVLGRDLGDQRIGIEPARDLRLCLASHGHSARLGLGVEFDSESKLEQPLLEPATPSYSESLTSESLRVTDAVAVKPEPVISLGSFPVRPTGAGSRLTARVGCCLSANQQAAVSNLKGSTPRSHRWSVTRAGAALALSQPSSDSEPGWIRRTLLRFDEPSGPPPGRNAAVAAASRAGPGGPG